MSTAFTQVGTKIYKTHHTYMYEYIIIKVPSHVALISISQYVLCKVKAIKKQQKDLLVIF